MSLAVARQTIYPNFTSSMASWNVPLYKEKTNKLNYVSQTQQVMCGSMLGAKSSDPGLNRYTVLPEFLG